MDAAELRALQAPIKERYRRDGEAALVTLTARGSLDESKIACKVETGRALALAGQHPATGGSGMELCSGDMLLEALVACAGVTLKAVSTALEIPLQSTNVVAEGDLDFRGTLGLQGGTGRIYRHPARVRTRLGRDCREAGAAAATYGALLRRLSNVARRCVTKRVSGHSGCSMLSDVKIPGPSFVALQIAVAAPPLALAHRRS
jgi:hypothetical protein